MTGVTTIASRDGGGDEPATAAEPIAPAPYCPVIGARSRCSTLLAGDRRLTDSIRTGDPMPSAAGGTAAPAGGTTPTWEQADHPTVPSRLSIHDRVVPAPAVPAGRFSYFSYLRSPDSGNGASSALLRRGSVVRIMCTAERRAPVTLSGFLQVLRERWRLVLAGLLLGLGLATAVTWSATPVYASTVVMFVSAQEQQNDATGAYQGSLMSQQKVKSYTQLLTSGRLRDDVAERTGIPLAADAITASSKPDSVLLTATVTDPSPPRARELAEAVGAAFPELVAELERPADGATPSVAVRVVERAGLPVAPVYPRPGLNLAVGGLLGLLAGLVAALARNAMDNSVKSVQLMEELTGAPALGTVAYSADTAAKPLIVHEPAGAPRAESYRQIRTNLQFVDVDHPPKVVAFTSSLPAEGKTTTVCNLAIALAQAGKRVAVVDADLRRPRIAENLGLEGAAGLTTVLIGRATLDQVLQPWGMAGVNVLTSGPVPPNPSELLASKHMADLLDELSRRFDFVLLDTPPLLPVTDAALLASRYDGALLIVRHGRTSRAQVRAAVAALNAVSTKVLGAVLTMTPRVGGGRTYGYYHYAYRSRPEREEQVSPLRRLLRLRTSAVHRSGSAERRSGSAEHRRTGTERRRVSTAEATTPIRRVRSREPARTGAPTEPTEAGGTR
jgi:capsular exopolysaccharide synthesis family protein